MNIKKLREQIDKIDKLEKLNFDNTQVNVWIVETMRLLETMQFDARHISNFDIIFNLGCVLTNDRDEQKEYLEKLKKAKEFLYAILNDVSVDRMAKQAPREHRKNTLLQYLGQLWQELKDLIARIISNLIKN